MRLKEKNLLQKFAATLKKFSAQGAKKVEYGMYTKFQILASIVPRKTVTQIFSVNVQNMERKKNRKKMEE